MATKKRLLLIAAVPLAIVVVLGVLSILPSRPGVTKANFDRIQVGMTRAQVEEIFGREGKRNRVWMRGIENTMFFVIQDEWVAEDSSAALVAFSFPDDYVIETEWHDSTETILDKIRRSLHLP